jgi:hypothetical protein
MQERLEIDRATEPIGESQAKLVSASFLKRLDVMDRMVHGENLLQWGNSVWLPPLLEELPIGKQFRLVKLRSGFY